MQPAILFLWAILGADPAMILKPDRVFDGNGKVHEGWVVLVDKGKI